MTESRAAKADHLNPRSGAVSFISSPKGKACLIDWHRRVEVADILTVLSNLKSATANGRPAVIVLVVRKTVPVPVDYILSSLQATMPAIIDGCEELVIAVEGVGAERSALRACFQSTRLGLATRNSADVFVSLGAAFEHAQRFAPHDVLELQRYVLHSNFPAAV